MNRLTLLLCAFALCATYLHAQDKPDVYFVSLEDNHVIQANPIRKLENPLVENAGSKNELMQLFPSLKYQRIVGLGGCFNEIGGLALASLPDKMKNELMQNLFSKDKAGFSYCRTAVGASDFGASAYSYSEIPNDYALDSFSLKREYKSVIPYLKLAKKYNPDMKLFASPWSPPAWMKESGKMEGDNDKNYLIDSPLIYKSYALYLAKYIEEYAKLGININRIMVQNETDCNPVYPSCIFPPDKMIRFINQYLVPTFAKRNIDTEIWGGTYRVVKNSTSYEALLLFSDSLIQKNVKGVGMQYQDYSNLIDFRLKYPQVPMMHTECVCYDGENTVEQAYRRLAEVAQYINAGAENFAYWNMILDETSQSGWGWKQNSLITIDRFQKTIKYNPDYAVMYLFSHFIRPGDVRIAHIYTGGGTFAVGNSEGKTKFFVTNKDEEFKILTVRIPGEKDLNVKIPGRSLAVVVI